MVHIIKKSSNLKFDSIVLFLFFYICLVSIQKYIQVYSFENENLIAIFFRFPKTPIDVKTKLAFIFVAHQQVGLFEILLHLTFR